AITQSSAASTNPCDCAASRCGPSARGALGTFSSGSQGRTPANKAAEKTDSIRRRRNSFTTKEGRCEFRATRACHLGQRVSRNGRGRDVGTGTERQAWATLATVFTREPASTDVWVTGRLLDALRSERLARQIADRLVVDDDEPG